MKFTEMVQVLWGAAFDLVGIDREPRSAGPVQVSNDAVRSLAHLVGFDGQNSRLVRVAPASDVAMPGVGPRAAESGLAGVLITVPFDALLIPDVTGQIVEGTSPTHDFLTAAPRLVRIDGPFDGTDKVGTVYDSTSSGDETRLIGASASGFPVFARTAARYLDVLTITKDNYWSVKAWLL
jgi:hypothetical protein